MNDPNNLLHIAPFLKISEPNLRSRHGAELSSSNELVPPRMSHSFSNRDRPTQKLSTSSMTNADITENFMLSASKSVHNLSGHTRPSSADGGTGIAPTERIRANTKYILPVPTSSPIFIPPQPTANQPTVPIKKPELQKTISMPDIRKKPIKYFENWVTQVDDFIYMGGIEAAYNANLLCRLGIEYIIDLSDTPSHLVPREKKSDCPCLCTREIAHNRARMTIGVAEHTNECLNVYFDELNQFIKQAKQAQKAILIHSFHGKNRCAVAVIQHFMQEQNVDVTTAEEMLRERTNNVHISPNFYVALDLWQQYLRQKRRDSQYKPANNFAPFVTKKKAWQ